MVGSSRLEYLTKSLFQLALIVVCLSLITGTPIVLAGESPDASRSDPNIKEFEVPLDGEIEFLIDASDPDGDLRGSEWYVDGTQKSQFNLSDSSGTATWGHTFSADDYESGTTYNVEGMIFDEQDNYSDSVVWKVKTVKTHTFRTITISGTEVYTKEEGYTGKTPTIEKGEPFNITAKVDINSAHYSDVDSTISFSFPDLNKKGKDYSDQLEPEGCKSCDAATSCDCFKLANRDDQVWKYPGQGNKVTEKKEGGADYVLAEKYVTEKEQDNGADCWSIGSTREFSLTVTPESEDISGEAGKIFEVNIRATLVSEYEGTDWISTLPLPSNDDLTSEDQQEFPVLQFDLEVENPPPVAKFDYSPSDPAVGDTVTFDASNSSGSIDSYEWDFDEDGDYEKSGQVVKHSFQSSGDHEVTLEVEDDQGLSDTKTVTIFPQAALQLVDVQISPTNPQLGKDTTIELTVIAKNLGDHLVSFNSDEVDVQFIDLQGEGQDIPGIDSVEEIKVRSATTNLGVTQLESSETVEANISVDTFKEEKLPLVYADKVTFTWTENNNSVSQNISVAVPEEREVLFKTGEDVIEAAIEADLTQPFKNQQEVGSSHSGRMEPQVIITIPTLTFIYLTTATMGSVLSAQILATHSATIGLYLSNIPNVLSKWALKTEISWEAIKAQAVDLLSDLKDAIDFAIDTYEVYEKWINEGLVTLKGLIENGLASVEKAIEEGLISTVEAIKKDLISAKEAIEEGLISASKAINEGLISASKAIREGLISGGKAARKGFIKSWKVIKGGLHGAGSIVSLYSPANIVVIDSSGNKCGYVDGNKIEEIPGCKVGKPGEEVVIDIPQDVEDYKVIVTGQKEGDVGLVVGSAKAGKVIGTKYEGVSVKEGTQLRIHSLASTSSQAVASTAVGTAEGTSEPVMEIDRDGDGDYEETKEPNEYINREQVSGDSPAANFDYSPKSPGTKKPVKFDATSSSDPDGQLTKYEWDFDGDGLVDALEKKVNHTFSSSGTYSVSLTVTDNEGKENSFTRIIDVNDPPKASFTYKSTSPVTDGALKVEVPIKFNASNSSDPNSSIKTYKWDWQGDGTFEAKTSDPEITHTYSNEGEYTVKLKVVDKEGTTNSTSKDLKLTELDEVKARFGPNPASKETTLFYLLPTNVSQAELKVFNSSGKLVYSSSLSSEESKHEWSLNNEQGEPLANGIYMYMVKAGRQTSDIGKLMVERG